MRIYYLIFSLFINLLSSFGQSPQLSWAKGILGGDTLSINISFATESDKWGNVYTVGYFARTSDFDPGPLSYSLTSSGWFDGYILKLDSNGNFIWAKKINCTNGDGITDIAINDNGDLFLTGYFTGIADFDLGTGTYTLNTGANMADPFVLKLDSGGNFKWVKHFYGPGGGDGGKSIALDKAGNIYVGGDFNGIVDFDPGINVFNLSPSSNYKDFFILKLDSLGDFVWANKIGGKFDDYCSKLIVDSNNNCFISGFFSDTVDFNPGISSFNVSSNGNQDIFLLKLDSNGNFLWVKNIGGIGNDFASDFRIDKSSNIIITGQFDYTIDFDPSSSVYNIGDSSLTNQFYVSKLDSFGNLTWVKYTYGIFAPKLDIDSYNHIYLTGKFKGNVDFDFGIGTFSLSSSSAFDTDGFLLVTDPLGWFVWAGQMVGPSVCEINAIEVNKDKNVILTGGFLKTCDFDPNTTSLNITSKGGLDMFIEKIKIDNFASINDNQFIPTLSVSPNPSNGLYNCIFLNPSEIIISNSIGQEIIKEKRNVGDEIVDLRNQSNGIYFLKVISSDNIYNFKLIKQ